MAGKSALLCMISLLAACSPNHEPTEQPLEIGKGEINFSVSAMATFRYYTRQKMPGEFVVTKDGERGFYSYCTYNPNTECRENTSEQLLALCRERSGKTCKVFATKGKVVWKDPGLWRTDEKVGMHFFVDHKGVQSHKL